MQGGSFNFSMVGDRDDATGGRVGHDDVISSATGDPAEFPKGLFVLGSAE